MPNVEKSYKVNTKGVGTPDYAAPAPISAVPVGTVFSSSDISELAARIRPGDTLDRRGNVIIADDFQDGVEKWVRSEVTWSAARSRSSGFSAYFNPAVAPVYAFISTQLPLVPRNSFGFSFTFNLPASPTGTRVIRLIASYHYGGGTGGMANGFRYTFSFDWDDLFVGMSPTGNEAQ